MIENIASLIKSASKRSATKLIAIDGRGGSGKTLLANRLKDLLPEVQIVHIDSFPATAEENLFHPLGTQTQISSLRVVELVLNPLAQGQSAKYRASSWWIDQELKSDEEVVTPGASVIIEGCYSLRREFSHFYDYKIWVQCSARAAMERALRRDGGEKERIVWEEVYLPNEERYIQDEKPHQCADVLVDANGNDFQIVEDI